MVSVADNAFGADLMEDEGRQRTEAIRVRIEDCREIQWGQDCKRLGLIQGNNAERG